MEQRKKILVCPLDWGLGHATRCIPIIEELLKKGNEVCVASSGSALSLLRNEYPSLRFFEIAGYRPRYHSGFLLLSLALQIPKFLRTIRQEHKEISTLIKEQKIDLVISDNRYGCWSAHVSSIFITHQLTIQAPVLSWIVNFLQRKLIKNFSACWVPDVAGEHSLAGKLSARGKLKVTYIGHLSRFQPGKSVPHKYDVLALISGPEPQRSIFEKLIRGELQKSGMKAMMVKGTPGSRNKKISGDLDEVSHLDAKEMNQAIVESDIVISRPGYSTIMDLAKLSKRAVFIPTPGQTEQEYLGGRLMKNEIALSVPQDKFDLQIALKEETHYKGFGPWNPDNLLQAALNSLLSI